MKESTNIMTSGLQKKEGDRATRIIFLLLCCFYLLRIDKMIPGFNAFITIFISIVLEAVPFLLIGTLISSIINSFVTTDFINKHLPKNKFLAIIAASLFGLVFPICECAIIPVARRLIKKGLPIHTAVTFLFAAPIINPVVILSTYYAFNGELKFVIFRIAMGLTISILIGLRLSFFSKEDCYVLKTKEVSSEGHEHCVSGSCHCHSHERMENEEQSFFRKAVDIINHARGEFFDVIGFFILGALISSVFNTYLPRDTINVIGGNPLISTVIMMTLAYVLSICSESDAFIARTFTGSFPQGSVLSFMVFGPMLDIKNTLMLLNYFKPRFVVFLITYLVVLNFTFALVMDFVL